MVEILADFFVLMVFFYRRFLPLDVCIYAFGAESDDSSSNLPIPLKLKGLPQALLLRQSLFYARRGKKAPTDPREPSLGFQCKKMERSARA